MNDAALYIGIALCTVCSMGLGICHGNLSLSFHLIVIQAIHTSNISEEIGFKIFTRCTFREITIFCGKGVFRKAGPMWARGLLNVVLIKRELHLKLSV